MRGQSYRPPGSLCTHCNYRPARIHARWQKAGLYCSDVCRVRARDKADRQKATLLFNELRRLVGLPAGGCSLSIPEMEALVRRVGRVAPIGGMSPYPASPRSIKRVA